MKVKKEKSSNKLLSKAIIDEIKLLSKEITLSKKKCNLILKLFEVVEGNTSEDVSLASIRAIHKIFCFYLGSGDIQQVSVGNENTDSSAVQFQKWLKERYDQSIKYLFGYITHESASVRELAVCTLMKYVEAEGKKPLEFKRISKATFPKALFEDVVTNLVRSEDDQEELISRFQEYIEYDDVRFNFMKILLAHIKQQKSISEDSDDVTITTRLNNTLNALLVLSLPDDGETLSNFLVPVENVSSAVSSIKVQRQSYSNLWLEFFKLKLTGSIYKKILIALPDKIIPHLSDPLIVSDWLISCYDKGGAVSLMALNGLFVLMTQYSLEYPDFYTKLYSVMGSEILSAKYMARFFHLLDIFLQSLLLPTSTVAAFIKKLSRMALTAPPPACLLILEQVINLLIRYETCRMLIHRDDSCDLSSDPYLPDEPNLSKCKATDSSLWEIKTLQKHWHHRIATQALRIQQPLPQVESVMDELLENNYEKLMEKETKKSKKAKAKPVDVPINHLAPSKLLDWEFSELKGLWTFQQL